MKTKEKILYCTLELASKEGLGRISMNDIASAVGIKKPSLYNHYKSKEELMKAMFIHVREMAQAKFPADDMDGYIDRFPTEAILYHAVDQYCKWNQDEDVMKLNRVIISEKMTDKFVASIDQDETEERVGYFIDLLTRMESKGKCKVVNKEFAAKLLVYHMQKIVEHILMGEEGTEKDVFNLTHNFAIIFARGDL